ncbi:SusC/RagA family TonB-linked outer membrane protein [Dyadobacter fanqingshengii]|uniref:TonB-dependent receptor n=1 Tax=Dyadobacter fanqingshengii TaxID=2906443 RepID=A0A9X1TAM8_9BACT|nr:TonB-dependent receptor [Dyadobacter fanqingshengii]MCF0042755.1 TonB-dependent receptor [Dyadobacter fanqingshengii]USJ36023.1 TonB-dependent receptor [Dyadobacter fanqingshengii]
MKRRILESFLLMVLHLGLTHATLAQSGTVTGKVTDEKGEGIPGASVTVKGTQQGTLTTAEGTYSIEAAANATLVFSFVGYLGQEIAINNRTTIDINLKTDTKALEEVVVVGYGTQRRVETTGSIASVKAEDLVQTPVANIAQGLQARVSGMQINQNSGAPGGNISVRIRGTNSINGSSEPLYVIDGIQISNGGGITDVSPLSTINPNDIESVEVLKDASASAIYGARAANGVVLITTKRGKSGKTTVTFDSYYGTQKVNKQLDVLNASEFAQLENEAFKNNYYPDPASLGEGVNWQNYIFRKAPIQNHQLSINGGNEKTQLALSLNYFDQQGTFIGSSFKRYSYRLNLDHRLSKKVKIGTSILGSYSINDGIQTGGENIGDGGAVLSSVLGAAIGAPPTLKPYREDGSIFPFGEQAGGQYREVVNPLNFAAITNNRDIKRTLANLYAEVNFVKGLTYRASFNIDQRGELYNSYSPRSIVNKSDLNDNSGSGSKANGNFLALLHESILTYNTNLGKNHTFKATAVFGTQLEQSNSNSMSASGFPNDATQNEALQLALTRTVNSSRSNQRLDSYLARVNYGFKDKLFLDLTTRIDGSSKFGANHKYGLFPAISAAYRLIEEPFVKDLTWLSDLKLRGSFGITGNAGGISPYQSLSTAASTGSDYLINHTYTTGINPTGIANPDLRWERSRQANLGIDISLLNNRVSFIADVYHKKTDDLLYVKTLPLSAGYGSITGNYASLENKGLELALNARILDGPLKWDVSANTTFNRNKVLDLDGGVTKERFVTTYTVLSIGQPLGMFKTYVFDGVNQTGEAILPGYDGRLGGHKVKDVTGDNQITAADQVIVGNPNPKFIYGFSTNLAFQGFDLGVFISGSQGNDIYNASRLSFENPLGQRNLLAGVADRWSPTNPSNQYVSAAQGGRLPISSYVVEDGSYMRCKNLTLGYTLPRFKGVQGIRLYVSANNLFTITNYSGYDPEVNTYAGSNTIIGVDNFVYPQSRSFLGGIQVTF